LSEPFTAAAHNDVLQVLVSLAALLLLARLLGEVATRLKQPAVVGEIVAGVLLGPSLLGVFAPQLARWVIPQTPVQGYLLEMVALIGVMFLLVITGLETDLTLIRRKAKTAMGVAVGGLVLPFASGLVLGWYFPADLMADPDQRVVFSLFLATALSISAIPVLAKILMDLRVLRRDLGQTMLSAGMIDDITGWTMLGIVAALAGAGGLSVGQVVRSIMTVVVFVGATALVGRVLVSRSLAFVQDRLRSRDRLLTLVAVLAFAWAAFTQWLGLEPVLGAFAIGILFGQLRRLPADVSHKLETFTLAIFAPIFFAVAGLKVDISLLAEPRLLQLTGVVIAVATFGKVVGAYLGARYLSKQGHWTALAYGAGLNARGAVEIIIASIGLSLGILTQEVFSMVVVMAIVTSLIAPFALRLIIPRIELDAEEVARIRREDLAEVSLTGGIRRVLVPVRPRGETRGGAQQVEASILRRLTSTRKVAITLLSVARRGERSSISEFQDDLAPLFGAETEVTRRIVEARNPAAAVLAELERDYDLVVLGASEGDSTAENLFGGVVDEIVRLAPVPSLVVRGGPATDQWRPRKIVVPTDGTVPSRRAAELAFTIAEADALVTIVHVVPKETSAVREVLGSADPAARLEIGQQIATDLRSLGESYGVDTEVEVKMGPEPEEAILATARRVGADLVVLGTSVRVGSSRLFLGPRVERILSACPCPVVVLNS
jgi:Kef-type K+ transport system membrane component KefB